MTNKILVVDDDKNIVLAIETILNLENYDTISAFTGEESIKKAKSEQPMLILLDFMLPDMTGKQVVERIRRDDALKDIPIILISATHDLIEICKEIQIQGIIEKPFDLETLTSTVAKITANN